MVRVFVVALSVFVCLHVFLSLFLSLSLKNTHILTFTVYRYLSQQEIVGEEEFDKTKKLVNQGIFQFTIVRYYITRSNN